MNLSSFRQLNLDYNSSEEYPFPNSITLNDLIQSNARFVTPSNLDLPIDEFGTTLRRYLKYEVDHKLAQYFPILGVGTEKLVFDIGTAVLKRYVSDGRHWEFPLEQMAEKIPGLFSPQYFIPVSDSEQTLLVQEKLTPINPVDFKDLIFKYYPTINNNPYVWPNNWKGWEWGLDNQAVPHVYDWG